MKKIILVVLVLLLSGCSSKSGAGGYQLIDRSYEDLEVVSEFDLFMVGDALLHGAVYKQVQQSDGTYDFYEMTKALEDIVSQYDLAYYNQETILGGSEIGLSTYPRFNSPQEFGEQMVDYGFNLVSLANNHTLDRNEEGILLSHEFWDKYPDVMTAGSYTSFEERNEFDIRYMNGISYTMLSYTYGTNGLPIPSGKEYLVNVYTDEMLKEDISRIRDEVDFLIVAMHWGAEYTHVPTDEEFRVANILADLGVDLVIGAHPHVIQPIEWIDDTLVYYSLGNLISAQDGTYKLIGMMGAVTVNKKISKDGIEIYISDESADLIYTSYQLGSYANLHLTTFDELGEDYKSIYDEYSKIINKMVDITIGNVINRE